MPTFEDMFLRDWKRRISTRLQALPILDSRDILLFRTWLKQLQRTLEDFPYFKELVCEGMNVQSLKLDEWDISENDLEWHQREMELYLSSLFGEKTMNSNGPKYKRCIPTSECTPSEVYSWLLEENEARMKDVITEYFVLSRQDMYCPIDEVGEMNDKLYFFEDIHVFVQRNYGVIVQH